MRALSVVWLVLALLTLGCRPSIRAAQPGNSYFERCFAADRDPAVSDARRLECWQTWLDHHTEGQPVEKVRHARERIEALAIALHAPAPPPPEPAPDAAPVPPDGGVTDGEPPGAPAGPAAPVVGCPARPASHPGIACPSPPDDARGPCADVCNPRWYACVGRCMGYEKRCVGACRVEHRTCMAACY